MGKIGYAISAAITLWFVVSFLIAENNSPGLSFAIALLGMPLLLLIFGLLKSSKRGITKDGKGAGWAAFVIAILGFLYIARFFSGWSIAAAGWLLAFSPALIVNLISPTTTDSRRRY